MDFSFDEGKEVTAFVLLQRTKSINSNKTFIVQKCDNTKRGTSSGLCVCEKEEPYIVQFLAKFVKTDANWHRSHGIALIGGLSQVPGSEVISRRRGGKVFKLS